MGLPEQHTEDELSWFSPNLGSVPNLGGIFTTHIHEIGTIYLKVKEGGADMKTLLQNIII